MPSAALFYFKKINPKVLASTRVLPSKNVQLGWIGKAITSDCSLELDRIIDQSSQRFQSATIFATPSRSPPTTKAVKIAKAISRVINLPSQ
jgi:hypothetical protein